MNLATVIVLLCVAVLFVLALRRTLKKGGGCGCGGECSGGCAGCAGCGTAHKKTPAE